jgi:hypothetical protein
VDIRYHSALLDPHYEAVHELVNDQMPQSCVFTAPALVGSSSTWSSARRPTWKPLLFRWGAAGACWPVRLVALRHQPWRR